MWTTTRRAVTANAIDDFIVLTTQDAETDGDPTAEDTASASIPAAFLAAAVPVYGADGPGMTVISGYALNLAGCVGNGFRPRQQRGSDQPVQRGRGNCRLDGAVAPATATDASVVFSIAVDSAGLVTLTQYAEIDHLPEDVDATNDNFNIGLATGLVTLTATATVTDGDNDTTTTTVSADLGGNISFNDDVPTANANIDSGVEGGHHHGQRADRRHRRRVRGGRSDDDRAGRRRDRRSRRAATRRLPVIGGVGGPDCGQLRHADAERGRQLQL